jgi:integrase
MNQNHETKERRARGDGRIYLRRRIWWIQYTRNGRHIFESSRSGNRRAAENLLRLRLGQVAAGISPMPRAHRITYENLRDALLADYAANRRKWLRTGKAGSPYICGFSTLDSFFRNFRALEITTDLIRSYIRNQQEQGSANGTINRSLALLRRMFRLAVADGKLRDVPHFPMLKEAPPRKGFLEHANYQKLRLELPEHLRPVLAMGYHTGMRRGEILKLR